MEVLKLSVDKEKRDVESMRDIVQDDVNMSRFRN